MVTKDAIRILCGAPSSPAEWLAERYTLLLVKSGLCRMTIAELPIELRQGDALLLQCGVSCQADCESGAELWVAECQPYELVPTCLPLLEDSPMLTSFFMSGGGSDGIRYLRFAHADASVLQGAEALLQEYRAGCPYGQKSLLCGVVRLLLAMSATCFVHASAAGMSGMQTCRRVLAYLEAHCPHTSLEEVAEVFHFHPNTVAQMLKRHTGKSFQELRSQMRIERAAKLLTEEHVSVQRAAELCGYANMSNFYTQFRRQYGVTPGEYVRQG